VKADGLHFQGSGVGSGDDSVFVQDTSDFAISNTDDDSSGNWHFENAGGGMTDIHLNNIDLSGDLEFINNDGAPQRIFGSNIQVSGSFESQASFSGFGPMLVRGAYRLTGGDTQTVYGTGFDSPDNGVEFDGGIEQSLFIGQVDRAGTDTVNFGDATSCIYIGNVTDGATYGANQTDCDIWPTGHRTGAVSVGGTRPRWFGVIGGGPLGGIDLSNTTGQYVGDRAIADGTSTAAAGALARWDGSGWQYHDPTGTV